MEKGKNQRELLFGVSVASIVRLCRVNRVTAARWKRGQARVPFAAYALIVQDTYGLLPPIAGDAWRGWRFGQDGRFYAPDIKRGYEPHHIRMLDVLVPMFSWHEQLRQIVGLDLDQGRRAATGEPERGREREQDIKTIV